MSLAFKILERTYKIYVLFNTVLFAHVNKVLYSRWYDKMGKTIKSPNSKMTHIAIEILSVMHRFEKN